MRYHAPMAAIGERVSGFSLRIVAKRANRIGRAVSKRFVSFRANASRNRVLANLRAVPLTVTGLACVDVAAFEMPLGRWTMTVGLLVTGLSAFYLEHVIADES